MSGCYLSRKCPHIANVQAFPIPLQEWAVHVCSMPCSFSIWVVNQCQPSTNRMNLTCGESSWKDELAYKFHISGGNGKPSGTLKKFPFGYVFSLVSFKCSMFTGYDFLFPGIHFPLPLLQVMTSLAFIFGN